MRPVVKLNVQNSTRTLRLHGTFYFLLGTMPSGCTMILLIKMFHPIKSNQILFKLHLVNKSNAIESAFAVLIEKQTKKTKK